MLDKVVAVVGGSSILHSEVSELADALVEQRRKMGYTSDRDPMNEALENAYAYKYDRSQERKKRDKYEIGISAVRGGSIVGEHEVIFAGQDEVIEFKHTAYSKAVFAKGAVEAAKYLAGKPAGHYEMSDVIKATM